MRLDNRLAQIYPEVSRAQLQRLIRSGNVSVNDIVQTKNGLEVTELDSIAADFDDNPTIESIDLPIVYESNDVVVINKPVGVLTHSKGAFNPEASVASWLATRPNFDFTSDDGNARLGIVHRLDRATSGIMICAKNPQALSHLQKQFQHRKAKKTYIARIAGVIKQPEALIDLPIERNPKSPQRFRVGQSGKPSQTYYKQLRSTAVDSLLELKPTTGRTHQLRVHLAYLGHPIVGDTFYGGRAASRLFLHAHKLEITLPGSERVTFEAPLPKEFNA